MKKLMFALVAAGAAAVMADGIESQNVVGYQQISTPAGSSMRCPTLKTVSGSGYDLTAITVTGAEGVGDVCAQIISPEGEWDGEYYYLTEDGAGATEGWYRDGVGLDPVVEGDVPLAIGAALYVSSEYNTLTLNVSGEVHNGAYVFDVPTGSSQFGNASPNPVDLTQITVAGSEGMGDVCAQSISAEGEWDGEYYYLTEDGAGATEGWYRDGVGLDPVVYGDVTLPAGESLYISSEYNDLTFTLPAVLPAN